MSDIVSLMCTEIIENVDRLYQEGFSCSQAVFGGIAPLLGIEGEQALRIAAGMGGGMGRQGEVCGAVSGALMIIGFINGSTDPDDKERKEATYDLVKLFVESFKARNQTILCRELLACDISQPGELERARQDDLFKQRCPAFVHNAAEILVKMDIIPHERV